MRICAECKWYQAGRHGYEAECLNPKIATRDIVTGEYRYASCVRERRRHYDIGPILPGENRYPTQCGPDGELWEAPEVPSERGKPQAADEQPQGRPWWRIWQA